MLRQVMENISFSCIRSTTGQFKASVGALQSSAKDKLNKDISSLSKCLTSVLCSRTLKLLQSTCLLLKLSLL